MDHIQIDIITQEKAVLSDEVEAVTAPASEGEVTILPNHIPLFTKLNPGELKVLQRGHWSTLAVAGGFMDVGPSNKVTILADSAVRIDEINIAKAEAAKRRAEERLQEKLSDREHAFVAAELQRVGLELKVALKHRRRVQNLPGE